MFTTNTSHLILEAPACSYPPKYINDSELRYTGIAPIDYFGCVGSEFIKTGLFRHVQPFTIYLLSSMVPIFLVFNIEGLRKDGPSRWFPLIVAILGQCSNAGVAGPIGWLCIFLSQSRHARRPLTKEDAEAAFLSNILGYAVPTAVMIITVNEVSIFLWMFYCFFTFAIQSVWLRIRPATNQSGFFTTQFALFTVFLASTLIHLTMLVKFAPRSSWSDFIQWLPSWNINNPQSLTSENALLRFFQWDGIFAWTSGILAGFLYTDSWPELLLYAMATPMVLVGFGPGALISAMWMWREWKLTMLEEAEAAALKAQDKKEE